MASDNVWKCAEFQIETIVPGVLILAEAHALAVKLFDFRVKATEWMRESEFVRAALFIAGAYSLGVVSSLVARVLVDWISECYPRKCVFGAFAHHDLCEVVKECRRNDPRFLRDYEREKKKRKWTEVAAWNAVYRSALRRTTRSDEVDRRRSQGRLVRNLLLPTIGAPLVLFSGVWSMILAVASIPCLVF